MAKEYFFCNQEFLNHFGSCQKSKPIDRFGDPVYIAELSWDNVKSWIDKKGEDFIFDNEIFVWKIEGGIEFDGLFDFSEIEERGLFDWIMWHYNLGKENNQAQILNTVCRYQRCTPIELFNKLSSE